MARERLAYALRQVAELGIRLPTTQKQDGKDDLLERLFTALRL